MSNLKDELTEKMSEARGMLSNLIFGKKQKKPKELVRPQCTEGWAACCELLLRRCSLLSLLLLLCASR